VNPPHPTARVVACASRDIIGKLARRIIFWPHCLPDQLGLGSSSLPALIEGKFTPFCDEIAVTVALISRVLRIVKKRMTFKSTFLFE
jgi:hypothetical protein